MTTIYDAFIHVQGSKVWPSSDPNDSPFDNFTCKICGHKLSIQMYGSWMISGPTLEEQASIMLSMHLLEHCSDEFLKIYLKTSPITTGPAFNILLMRELKGQLDGKP